MKTTPYFERVVIKKHPEADLYRDRLQKALSEYEAFYTQANGRTRRWIFIPEEDRYMRVVVEPDGETIHDAFFDRNFTRRMKQKGA